MEKGGLFCFPFAPSGLCPEFVYYRFHCIPSLPNAHRPYGTGARHEETPLGVKDDRQAVEHGATSAEMKRIEKIDVSTKLFSYFCTSNSYAYVRLV